MINLSPSSISDFIKCSQMFYYRSAYSEESVSTQEMSVGTVVHKMLEDKALDLTHSNFEHTIAEYIRPYQFDRKGIERVKDCIKGFVYDPLYTYLFDKFSDKDLVEFFFSEKISEDVTIRGKMDRVLVNDDIVIDWKTGSTVRKYLGNDIQSIVYYVMYNRIFGRYPKIYVINLLKGDITGFEPSKRYINTLFNDVIPSIVNRIKSQDFTREGYFNHSCRNCSFIGICDKQCGT